MTCSDLHHFSSAQVRDASTEPLFPSAITLEASVQHVARQLDAAVQWPLEPPRRVDAATMPLGPGERPKGSMASGIQSFDLPVALRCQERK